MSPEFIKYQQEVEREMHQIWFPHNGQLDIVKALLIDWASGVFLQCGRKFGKTELAIYLLFMYAILFEGSECYFVADEKDHARKILWNNGRLPRFFTSFRQNIGETYDDFKARRAIGQKLQDKWVKSVNNVDMTVTLTNQSIIMVEGAKNYSKADGLSPTFAVYDEFKHHDPKFDVAMRPNFRTFNGRILIMGTPPDNEDNYYCKIADEFRHKKGHMWVQKPSWMNPHVYTGPRDEGLAEEEKEYARRKESHIFKREYLAQIVPDEQAMIFPMLRTKDHVGDYTDMVRVVKSRYRDWDLFVSFDPASTSCFGVLLVAINKFDKRVWLLDEVYEKSQMKTTSKQIWAVAKEKWSKICPMDSDWMKIYDYAAAWFATEIAVEFDEAVNPCTKDLKNKEAKLSLIKDTMLHNRFRIADNCVNTLSELQNYKKDEHGRIPKENDHNIDNLRYILNAAHYGSVPTEEIDPDSLDNKRAYSMEDDFNRLEDAEKLLGGHDGDYYHDGC